MAKTSLELLHISYSPWSEKARWALESRRVAYRSRHYQPLVGEPELRWRLRRVRGPVSVPVLFGPPAPIADSYDIARYAAQHGEGPDLFPAGSEPEIARWNALSEQGLAAGRVMSLQRVLHDEAALIEMVPKRMRPVLGRAAPKVAAMGIRRTIAKYADRVGGDDPFVVMCNVLDALRQGLEQAGDPGSGEPRTLLGEAGFSYADIAMAQVVAYVVPPTSGLRIGDANRRNFGDPELVARYPDLVAWRDALYARYRNP